MKKTFIILFFILAACSKSPKDAIENCADFELVDSLKYTYEKLCINTFSGKPVSESVCDIWKSDIIKHQEFIKQPVAVKLVNEADYVEEFRQCELEYKATPETFMAEWSN